MFKKYFSQCRFECMNRAVLLLFFCVNGCSALQPLPPVDLAAPGWKTRQGEAVWRSGTSAPEITGELLVAINPDGSSLVQFTKTPIPFVTAQCTSNEWQTHFVAANRTYRGRGSPPTQLIWFYLPRCLDGAPLPKPFSWQLLPDNQWRLENRKTGEMLQGYLNP